MIKTAIQKFWARYSEVKRHESSTRSNSVEVCQHFGEGPNGSTIFNRITLPVSLDTFVKNLFDPEFTVALQFDALDSWLAYHELTFWFATGARRVGMETRLTIPARRWLVTGCRALGIGELGTFDIAKVRLSEDGLTLALLGQSVRINADGIKGRLLECHREELKDHHGEFAKHASPIEGDQQLWHSVEEFSFEGERYLMLSRRSVVIYQLRAPIDVEWSRWHRHEYSAFKWKNERWEPETRGMTSDEWLPLGHRNSDAARVACGTFLLDLWDKMANDHHYGRLMDHMKKLKQGPFHPSNQTTPADGVARD